MSERVFNFNGANVTFNDIHDNTDCTIITGRAEELKEEAPASTDPSADSAAPATVEPTICAYIVPNNIKPIAEVEQEMKTAAKRSAPALINYIATAQKLGMVNLGGDDAMTIYTVLKEHFGLKYGYRNWMKYYS